MSNLKENTKKIDFLYFNEESKVWKYNYKNDNSENKKKLKILTYNTLFDKYDKELLYSDFRWKIQFVEFENIDADVMVLQEIRENYYNLIMKENFIQKNYFIVNNEKFMKKNYSTIILIKKNIKISQSHIYEFECIGGYECIITEIIINNNKLVIIGAHLRPYISMADLRQNQLLELYKFCEEMKWKDRIILGDFNFELKSEKIDENYGIDIWEHLIKNNEPTFNSKINKLIKFDLVGRLDRVVINKDMKIMKPNKIEIVFNKPFSEYDNDFEINYYSKDSIYPSDHFGLLSEFIFEE
jgi:poly(A) polymerase